MYADDLLLISSTCSDLRTMTKISEDEMKWLDKCFNSKNQFFVRFGSSINYTVWMLILMVCL